MGWRVLERLKIDKVMADAEVEQNGLDEYFRRVRFCARLSVYPFKEKVSALTPTACHLFRLNACVAMEAQ